MYTYASIFSNSRNKKSTAANSGEYGGMITILFLAKNSPKSIDVWAGALVFPQFRALLTNCFVQLAHNFMIVFLIDSTTLWKEFVMHHAIEIELNSEQNLHIWPPNFMCFFGLGFSGRCYWDD